MNWNKNVEIEQFRKELEGSFSRFIEREYLEKIGTACIKEYQDLYTKAEMSNRKLIEALREIAKVAGYDISNLSTFNISEVKILQLQEGIIKAITEAPSKPARKEKLLHLTISYESRSDVVKVDSKKISFFDDVMGCFDFEDDGSMMDHVVNEELIFDEYQRRYNSRELDIDDAKIFKSELKRLFKDLIADETVSLQIYSKFLEALLPTHRMSHNSKKWM